MLTGHEQMAPISQVHKALEIIENVQKISGDVWVNKHQCKRVAERFRAIGAGLNVDFSAASNGSNNMDYPAFDELLTVLRKGQALVSRNVQWAGIKGVLTWTDNREAFKEIHEELDTMKATFPFDGFSGDFETSSGIQRTAKLTQDADKDLEAMKHLPQSLPATEKLPEALNLEKFAKVVLEKSEAPSGVNLPSFLKIDLSTIDIKDPVRKQEFLSNQHFHPHGWAIVCEGSWLGCDYAVKVFKSDESQWNNDQLLKEARALMELRHPHIIRFIGFAQDLNMCILLMEMMPEKDLRHFMKQRAPGRRPFTRSQELDIITQIAKGMLYLHTQGYVHGDLKCSNILVKTHGPDYVEVKIGDLRYAQKLESAGGSSEINKVRRPRWTPREALDNYGGEKPTDDLLKQADVYSFAMTCYEVVTGKLPFQDVRDAALTQQIKEGGRPELNDDLQLHSGLKGLIESCWHEDPTQRPAFENICVLLVHIRSSMPAIITNTESSGRANVWNVIKQIPLALGPLSGWLRGMRAQAVDPEFPTTTWSGHPEKESGGKDDGAAIADALKIPACLKIEPETLKKVRRIGRGSFAKVYETRWLGCTFAVKRFKRIENVSTLQQEVDFLIQLRHPYIIPMVGLSIDKQGRCSIVMEYMDGSLRDLINSRSKKLETAERHSLFEFHEVVGIITKLAHGMLYLHSRRVVHRDLKARNVLCQEHAGSIDVKIVDFGVSQFIADAQTMLGVGTGYWRAPEIFLQIANQSRECDINLQAADVYSFSMTCYEVLTGLEPFASEFGPLLSKYNEVVNGVRPTLPPDLHYAGLNELIADCWQSDPVKRPDFAQICTRLNAISPHC